MRKSTLSLAARIAVLAMAASGPAVVRAEAPNRPTVTYGELSFPRDRKRAQWKSETNKRGRNR